MWHLWRHRRRRSINLTNICNQQVLVFSHPKSCSTHPSLLSHSISHPFSHTSHPAFKPGCQERLGCRQSPTSLCLVLLASHPSSVRSYLCQLFMQGVVSRFGQREKWAVFSPLFTPLPIVILGGGVGGRGALADFSRAIFFKSFLHVLACGRLMEDLHRLFWGFLRSPIFIIR